MGISHEDFAAELKNSFPETPESFRQLVKEEAFRHSASLHGPRRREKRKPFQALLPAAACLLLAGGTAAAAGLPAFQSWLASFHANQDIVEEAIVHSGDTGEPISMGTAPESENAAGDQANAPEEPLFTVTDVYYDGSTLMFWADPAGEYFSLGDHVFVNDCDSRLEYAAETDEDSGIYECKVTILDESLQETVPDTITVKVGVYIDSTTKVPYSFTVDSDKLKSSATARLSGSLTAPCGEITSYTVTIAPSMASIHLEWAVSDEAKAKLLKDGKYILEDAYGNRLAFHDWCQAYSYSGEEYDAETGCALFCQDLEIMNFDASSPAITLIPVSIDADAEGNFLYDTAEALEDMAFTIPLT